MPKSARPKKSEFERGRERGLREGSTEGYEFAMVIALLVLKDKLDISGEDLKTLSESMTSYTQMVRTGRFKFDMMRKTLKDEYGITFHWK